VSVQVQSKWWWTEGGESRAGRDKEQGEGERARRLGRARVSRGWNRVEGPGERESPPVLKTCGVPELVAL
jgi:hypothetical protein